VPRFDAGEGRVKVPAAWLIERSGFAKGYGMPGPAHVSTKHTLALVNAGDATTADLLALAREIVAGVRGAFAVTLDPEPVMIGAAL
jgi:UDP-N-acetylmuramate dehydrogenase